MKTEVIKFPKVKLVVDIHANGDITLSGTKIIIGTSRDMGNALNGKQHTDRIKDRYKGTKVDIYC